ncbi:MAG: methionine biosynthesis protein MetW [Desulfohalobiaceae bacterium]|nr:methionine biosynthesis protein MetW [Desulfohalobiaceae bacterium]
MRFDLKTIASWIKPGSRVLDLGCGSGELLCHLQEQKNVSGTGIEIDEKKASQAILNGVNVIHGDIHEEIQDYPPACFDYVILSQTLQQVIKPAFLLHEMLRVGSKGIVSFPNFSFFTHRLFFFFKGRAPISRDLPYEWFDTPNIRVIPLKDFHRFCHTFGFSILKYTAITFHTEEKGIRIRFLANLFATYGIYLLGRKG